MAAARVSQGIKACKSCSRFKNKSAHKESVRDLSFSRTDLKFCSCSDDTTVKVWDFARCQEESSLSGHGWDVCR
ncbi:hypothetical protein ACHQM5_008512 [Ranunculus cassubicifolius]